MSYFALTTSLKPSSRYSKGMSGGLSRVAYPREFNVSLPCEMSGWRGRMLKAKQRGKAGFKGRT